MTRSISAMNRRHFPARAAMLGATAAWAGLRSTPSNLSSREQRNRYPEGVVSGDPPADSIASSVTRLQLNLLPAGRRRV